jgi:hypothetical protein
MMMTRDQEDQPDIEHGEYITNEEEIPDENDLLGGDSETKYESNQNTVRESTPHISGQESRVSNHFNYPSPSENSLFTDPKLLSLIHTDLEDLKRRK